MDFDPRDYDSRDEERQGSTPSRGSRRGSDDPERDDDSRQPEIGLRDRDDDARTAGRGPGSERQGSDEHRRDHRGDARWLERHREHRDREYTLRGSESRTLATVGAFRVVSSRGHEAELNCRHDGHPRTVGPAAAVKSPQLDYDRRDKPYSCGKDVSPRSFIHEPLTRPEDSRAHDRDQNDQHALRKACDEAAPRRLPEGTHGLVQRALRHFPGEVQRNGHQEHVRI